jgi:hypothetical protein
MDGESMNSKLASVLFLSLFAFQNVHSEPLVKETSSTEWVSTKALEATIFVAATIASFALAAALSDTVAAVFMYLAPMIMQCLTLENLLKAKAAAIAVFASSRLRELATVENLDKARWLVTQVFTLYLASQKGVNESNIPLPVQIKMPPVGTMPVVI